MKKGVIVVAGGIGQRMGRSFPKQFLPIGGIPLLMRTMLAFYHYEEEMEFVLALPQAYIPYWKKLCEQQSFIVPHRLISGGATRFDSVYNALQEISAEVRLIAVHDGVRPLVSHQLIERAFTEAARSGAAIPVMPVVESLRCVTDGGSGVAVRRADYRSVQTPQIFVADILRAAYRQPYREEFTDDASVVEAVGYPVTLIEGETRNLKITTPYDLLVAETLCAHE
ncbi:MAG: 2-C-methyl-D-erythritol 4-phosphate cytidylyltransferase [Porphyromonadaceae bacterium]|nr:2-C-methyl-D-erythritol 4-phosphate cytidylyltransferase [Porphyromonadaceae bacterium]